MHSNATGHESGASLKQNIFNENRRMMLEMMVPLNSQLNDMKLLYENTKATSHDVEKKIDELKKVMAMQMNSLTSGVPMSGGSIQSTGQMNMFNQEGVLDPTILQKGIEMIKDQMKDVQREALLIETEMEKRFGDMLMRNTQRRYLPKSLTEEIIEHKQKLAEANVKQTAGIKD
jgi:hypothetical protein